MPLSSLIDPARLDPLRAVAERAFSSAEHAVHRAERAAWRVETVARVGKKLGFHHALTVDTLRLLAWEAAHGRMNPSLIYRFWAEATPDRPALVQATLPAAKGSADFAGRWPVFTIARAKKREYRRCRIACSIPPIYWSTFIQ